MNMKTILAKIQIISTVNGQTNEGMRNVATHLSKALEKEHQVYYSGLKNIISIIRYSLSCDVTLIFARANKQIYWLSQIVSRLTRNTWIVCVQKPDKDFTTLVRKRPLRVNYLAIVAKDLEEIELCSGYRKELLSIGIRTDQFRPVNREQQIKLKTKYGINREKPLVIHVGHCSAGRGLTDFSAINNAERMVVASGMFENDETVNELKKAGVRIHRGYLEHVEEIYQMADVYLFPVHSTEYVISIPLSVMEALACGVPVIAYDDFNNLCEIPVEKDAIILVSDKKELSNAVSIAAEKKRNKSYLKSPKAWEAVAEELLGVITG